MKRRSPPTDRVVDAIELLAAHPVDRFTLTEVYERLGMTKATCHVVLASLVERGWVVRDDRTKTYGLGPALVALGQAAQRSFFAVDIARLEIQAISDEVHEDVSIAAVVDREIVVLDRVGPTATHTAIVGVRVPFAPPFGAGMIAWASDADLEAWLQRARPAMGAADADRVRATMRAIGAHPFGVERLSPGWLGVRTLVDTVPEGLPENVRHLIGALVAELAPEHHLPGEFRTADRLSVGIIHAPVFDHDGRPVLSVAADVFRNDVSGRDVRRVGKRVAEGADAITAASGGRRPTTLR